jgi:hypothetical protein
LLPLPVPPPPPKDCGHAPVELAVPLAVPAEVDDAKLPGSAGEAAAAPSGIAGARTFRDWLDKLALHELNEVTASPTAFQEAEARWRKEHQRGDQQLVARRRRCDQKVNFKFAVGLAFAKWREGPGKLSRAYLRDRLVIAIAGLAILLVGLVLRIGTV